jgi:hypothetical protein
LRRFLALLRALMQFCHILDAPPRARLSGAKALRRGRLATAFFYAAAAKNTRHIGLDTASGRAAACLVSSYDGLSAFWMPDQVRHDEKHLCGPARSLLPVLLYAAGGSWYLGCSIIIYT